MKVGVCATLTSCHCCASTCLSHQGWLVKGTALQWLCQGHSGSWCHQVHLWGTVWIYLSSRSLDGGFLLWVDWCRTAGAVPTSLGGAPVDGICIYCGECTADIALHGVCSVAAGAAGVGDVGATAVGSITAWVEGADVDAAGATSPMLDVSGLIASKWHSQMWSQAHLYCPPPMTWTRYRQPIFGFMDDGGREPQDPGVIQDRYSLASKEMKGFLWQPYWLWYSALWVVYWLRWSHSASACGSVCLIHCGTVVHSTCWYNISAGECKWVLIGMLWYANRAKSGAWPEHLAWVSNPLTVLMVASTWPLPLGFLCEHGVMVKLPVCCKLGEECIGKLGAIVSMEYPGMPCSAKCSFRTEMVLEALYWDTWILLMMGILE